MGERRSLTQKEAATALGMLFALYVTSAVIAVVAGLITAVLAFVVPQLAPWTVWVSAYVAMLVVMRARAVERLWGIVRGDG